MIQCRKDGAGFIGKLVLLMILAGSTLLLPIISYAQDMGIPGECGVVGADPTDPYNPCPIDTWVWFLVIIAVILGSFYINTRKKLQKQA